jgi:hypothetical protein
MNIGFSGFPSSSQLEIAERSGLTAIIDSFPGSSRSAVLANGAAQARAALLKYTSSLEYDATVAAEASARVSAWEDLHGQELLSLSRSGANRVNQNLALGLPQAAAQQFVIASYGRAAYGLPAWNSGLALAKLDTYTPGWTRNEADVDSECRLQAFASIVKMDRDGSLAQLFQRPAAAAPPGCQPGFTDQGGVCLPEWLGKTSTSGLGAANVVVYAVAVAVTVVLLGAITAYVVLNLQEKKLLQFNKMMEDWYIRDPEGYKAGVKEVLIEQAKGDAAAAGKSDWTTQLATFAGLGLLAYVGVKYVLPAALDVVEKRKQTA